MSEENKAIVRRLYEEANNERELDVLDEIMDEGVTTNTPFPESKTGLDGFKEVYAEVHEAFPDYRITVEEQIAEGDKVVTRFSAAGTHEGEYLGVAGTGKRIELTGTDIDRLENGKIVDHIGEASMLDVARQLGLISA